MRKGSLLKKIAAAATAAVLIFSMGITAGASPAGDDLKEYGGTGDDKGSITVHKYSKVTESTTTNNTGEKLTDTSGLGTPLSGAGYTLYELSIPKVSDGKTFTDTYTTKVDAENKVTSVEMTLSDGTPVTIQVTDATKTLTGVTDKDGIVIFGKDQNGVSNLDQGYYLLQESKVPTDYTADEPTIISIPLTKKAGDGYVYDVHVYPKNISTAPITKILDDTSKQYYAGEEVDFTIDASFTNKEDDPNKVRSVEDLRSGSAAPYSYGEMKVTDELLSSLAYESSEVYYLTATNQKIKLTLSDHYTVDETNPIVWTLTEDGIDYIIDNKETNGEGITLEVKLKAIVQVSNESLTNQASSFVKKADATEDPKIDPPITPPVKVPTGQVIVDKVDFDNNNQKLANAQFALATNGKATSFLLVNGETADNITSLEALKKEISDRKDNDDPTDDIVVATTDTNGKALFSGLLYNKNNNNIYRLVEIAAPEGYQLKESAILADLAANADADDGELAEITVQVKNTEIGKVDPDNPKFSLPLTGGTGTLLFTIIGVLIMAATVIIYIRSKKRTN
ncbi:MAG: SpaH/EbpB family LPXTG-anchored major pilin [Lachnospiraceae bacterium]